MTLALATLAGLAFLPLGLGLVNLLLFRRAVRQTPTDLPPVSVLVPARDEADRLPATLEALRASRGVSFEVVVLDDASEDGTGDLVARVAELDPRVRCLRGEGPPSGWNGKQAACDRLGREARHELLLFLDADVHLAPDALARLVATMTRSPAALLSVFPREKTGSFLEALVIPLIHVVLLGYLPFVGLRFTRRPAFAAGCGQMMLVRRPVWRELGGHGAIRATRHDGVRLPRLFRAAGHATDLLDGTALAVCRMHEGARDTWNGLLKNADEGLGAPKAIVVWTILLLGGHVLPPLTLGAFLLLTGSAPLLLWLAAGAPFLLRAVLALRFRQSPLSVPLHPFGIAVLVAAQWRARRLRARGHRPSWRGRTAS